MRRRQAVCHGRDGAAQENGSFCMPLFTEKLVPKKGTLKQAHPVLSVVACQGIIVVVKMATVAGGTWGIKV